MEISQFEKFCQQVYAGECAALLKTLPPDEKLTATGDEATSDADLYTALHSLQVDPLYLASPEQSLLPLLRSRKIKLSSLSADSVGKLIFVERLFNSMTQDALLHGVPTSSLFQLKIIFSKLFINGKLFGHSESQIIETLMDTLAMMLMGWWPGGSGLDAQKRQENLLEISDVLLKNYFDGSGLLERQMNTLLEKQEQDQRRLLKLVNRNIDTQRGRMRLQHCEEVIADLYNSHFTKVTLPAALYDLLKSVWHDVLLRILLQKEEDHKYEILWKQAAQVTGLMMRSVQSGAYLKSFFVRAENLDDDVARIMLENKESQENIDQFVNVLRVSQKQMLRGDSKGYIQPELIKKGRYFENTKLLVSAHLKQKVAELELGRWYLYQPSKEERKLVKLVHQEEKYGSVLFSTLDGKLLGKSFDELVFYLTSECLKLIQRECFFKRHIELTLKHCWDLIENKDKVEKTHRLAALKQQKELKSEADQQALEKKIIEVCRLRQEHKQDKLVQEELTKSVKKMVSLLRLGSWVTIQNGEGDPQRAKLAVRLVSSGKLIFVDRSGQRVAEYTSKELVSLVVKGSVDIIHEGDDFNRTLASVVGRLS